MGDPFKPYAKNNMSMGFWEFNVDENKEEFATLKIVNFFGPEGETDPNFSPTGWNEVDSWLQLWKELSAAAAARGVSRLLVDVLGNGGGSVELAYSFVRSLFPRLGAREV